MYIFTPVKSLLFVFLLSSSYHLSAQIPDSLRFALTARKDDTTRVVLLLKAAEQFWPLNIDSSGWYANEALDISEKLGYTRGLMDGSIVRARVLAARHQWAEARNVLLVALHHARKLQLRSQEGRILKNAGTQSYQLGEYLVAEDFYKQALKISLEINDLEGVVPLYTNLGMTYTKVADYSMAFDALAQSNRLADSLGLRSYLGGNYIDIAVIFSLQKKYKDALAYYEKAIEVFKEESDPTMVGYAVLGKGDTYMQMGQFEQAVSFFRQIEGTLSEDPQVFTL